MLKSYGKPSEGHSSFDVLAATSRKSSAISYVGSLQAPSEVLARVYARSMFARRGGMRSLWVVRRTDTSNDNCQHVDCQHIDSERTDLEHTELEHTDLEQR